MNITTNARPLAIARTIAIPADVAKRIPTHNDAMSEW
jgi:hypothetical protein